MHEAVLVHMIDRIKQLTEDPPRLMLRELSTLQHVIEEITALSILHHQTQALAVLNGIDELDDVFVWRELGEDGMFPSGLQGNLSYPQVIEIDNTAYHTNGLGIGTTLVDDLDRRPSVTVIGMTSEEDPATSSLAELSFQYKVRYLENQGFGFLLGFWVFVGRR